MQTLGRWLVLSMAMGVLGIGCTCAQLPDARYACEANDACSQAGFVCGSDKLCHPPSDAGGPDSGEVDAGDVDAGEVDAGGVDAGTDDAGFDAGTDDAGFDAGPEDAGFDAGPGDAGFDAGFDAGTDAGFDAGSCTPTGAIDEPDPAGLDVDCDGFDGDLSVSVFVDAANGSDSAAGTRAAPVRTFNHASTLGKAQIHLSTGTFTGDVTLAQAVAVYGGYDATTWLRSTTKSVMTGSLLANPADAGRVVLERLEVQAAAAAIVGSASVAVTFRNAANTSRITSCRFVGGAGAAGANGAAASPVANGTAGGDGLDGLSGGDGGAGGGGANCGDAGTSPAGFAGGGSDDEGVGVPGDDVAQGGVGGAPTDVSVSDAGLDGGNGLAGVVGATSSARPSDPPTTDLGIIVAAQWQGVTLGTWAPAQSGRPGGGGGGGGGLIIPGVPILTARGGGAGGGGSGGCGGRSGIAGQAGGASIALVLFNSSPTLSDVQLVSGQAGRGGNGGTAGAGGTGGPGGAGSVGDTDLIASTGTAGSGGRGASGGAGGPGRQGPGGWGGPVVGLFCGGTSAPTLDGTTTWTTGTPGAAGTGDPDGVAGGQPLSGYSANCP